MNDAVLLLALGWGACDAQTLERDAARFLPDRVQATAGRQEAHQFRERVQRHAALDPTGVTAWSSVYEDATWCWNCWDALEDVRLRMGGVCRLRSDLERLRTLLGDEWYYTGTMPPAVPVWRLRYRD